MYMCSSTATGRFPCLSASAGAAVFGNTSAAASPFPPATVRFPSTTKPQPQVATSPLPYCIIDLRPDAADSPLPPELAPAAVTVAGALQPTRLLAAAIGPKHFQGHPTLTTAPTSNPNSNPTHQT
jgi:hypothetical protein